MDNKARESYEQGWRNWCNFGSGESKDRHFLAGYRDAEEANEMGGMRPDVSEAEEMSRQYLQWIEDLAKT